MPEITNYDPNPYDDVTIDEALAQIYDRVNDRTIRQMVTLLKNTASDTSRYTIEKATAESGEVTYKLMQQISGGTPTPVGDIVSLRGSQILANYDEELQILDNIISIIKVALDGKADTTDIPTVPITAIQKNGTGITPVDGTVNITVPIVAADVAALPDTTKYAAALSLTIDSATFVVTGQLKDQNGDNLGTAQTIDLPLESVVVGGSYNSQTQKVVLTLQNGNTIEFSVADLVYGLQTELSETNKLNPAYINYDSTHRAVSDAEKTTWNAKQDAIDSTHKLSSDLVDDTNNTHKFATAAQLEQIETNKNNISKQQDTTAQGGNGYALINGKRLYMSDTAPSGTIPAGSAIVSNGKVWGYKNSTSANPTLLSDGTSISDYTIKGNSGQNGTPTLGNPVNVACVGTLDNGNYVIPVISGGTITNVPIGTVQTTRQTKKFVLDGSEDWAWVAGSTGYSGYYRIDIGAFGTYLSGQGELCTHCQYVMITSTTTDIGFGIQHSTTLNRDFLAFRPYEQSSEGSLTAWKSYLAQQYANGTPIIAYCALTNSETLTSNEPLMKIGNYADSVTSTQSQVSIPTTAGENNITFGTSIQPSEFDITAWV